MGGGNHPIWTPNGAKPKWLRHGLLLPHSPEPGGQLPGAGVQPVGSGDGRLRPRRSYSEVG